jgi:hypothetical protein
MGRAEGHSSRGVSIRVYAVIVTVEEPECGGIDTASTID